MIQARVKNIQTIYSDYVNTLNEIRKKQSEILKNIIEDIERKKLEEIRKNLLN